MAKDRSRYSEDRNRAPSKRDRKYAYDSETESMSEPDEGSRRKVRSDSKRKRKSRDDEEDSHTTSSSASESDDYTDSYSESESEPESGSSEEDRRGMKRKERKRREEEERRRRRKERERKRKRRKEKEEKEERKRRKEKKEEKKKKKKHKDKSKPGAVTNSWGKYGIIRETDMWNKRPEFTAWLAEVKKVNLESLPNWEEKQMFKEFMEDHNTATFPSKKYYDLDAYHIRKMEKEMKKGSKNARVSERTVFDDEEQRRQEMLRERERQKQEQVESLKLAMQSGMAQAMKEQAQLREEMAFQYKIGNFEAAAAIQRRLDPDVAQ